MIRLLTYNIHGCVGRRGVCDPDRVLAVIAQAQADVVALQEVHHDNASDRSFLRVLEKRLDYPHVLYGPTMRNQDAHYGNLLMTRLIPRTDERIDLSQRGREPRGAIRIRLDHLGREIEITGTHLGLSPRERRAQVQQLIDWAPPAVDAHPIRILMGDLNEWMAVGRTARRLQRHFGPARNVATFPARCPLFALDRIHVLPGDLRVDTRIPDFPEARTASDHLPLLAELRFRDRVETLH